MAGLSTAPLARLAYINRLIRLGMLLAVGACGAVAVTILTESREAGLAGLACVLGLVALAYLWLSFRRCASIGPAGAVFALFLLCLAAGEVAAHLWPNSLAAGLADLLDLWVYLWPARRSA